MGAVESRKGAEKSEQVEECREGSEYIRCRVENVRMREGAE